MPYTMIPNHKSKMYLKSNITVQLTHDRTIIGSVLLIFFFLPQLRPVHTSHKCESESNYNVDNEIRFAWCKVIIL